MGCADAEIRTQPRLMDVAFEGPRLAVSISSVSTISRLKSKPSCYMSRRSLSSHESLTELVSPRASQCGLGWTVVASRSHDASVAIQDSGVVLSSSGLERNPNNNSNNYNKRHTLRRFESKAWSMPAALAAQRPGPLPTAGRFHHLKSTRGRVVKDIYH